MSQGWFGGKQKKTIDISEREEKKELNIWKQQQEINIPDIEDHGEEQTEEKQEKKAQRETLDTVILKVDNLLELRRKLNPNSMLDMDDDIDLGVLTEGMATMQDVNEKNELWEFQTLKNEISATVYPIFKKLTPSRLQMYMEKQGQCRSNSKTPEILL